MSRRSEISPQMAWFLFFALIFTSAARAGAAEADLTRVALEPPRGWNSYDSFSWVLREEEFIENARLVAQYLLEFGYEYVVVDFLWYRKEAPGVTVSTGGHDLIDQWGRPMPDPNRWPSSANGKGFRPVADIVHAMGLKFGIHVMRGISTAAVLSNTPILGAGASWKADDIDIEGGQCSWMPACFVGVDCSTAGGQAFVQSLYQQYADWGVDFGDQDLGHQDVECRLQL